MDCTKQFEGKPQYSVVNLTKYFSVLTQTKQLRCLTLTKYSSFQNIMELGM